MKLENEFTVNTSIDEAWKALNDLEQVTPCLPGAQLTAEVGDEYEGTMTVKMGPVTQKYNGTVKIDIGAGNIVTSSITEEAIADLGLAEGDAVTVVIKASDVMIGK